MNAGTGFAATSGRFADTIAALRTATDSAAMSDRLRTEVVGVEVLALKPGRRAVLRYRTADGDLIGKVRAGHRPASPYRLMQRFRAAGFDRGDVRVAEPVAVFDDLDMWVQRAAPGVAADRLLDDVATATVGARFAANALHRIHRAGVSPKRVHTIDDELSVLERRLADVIGVRPDLADRIRWLVTQSRRRAGDAHDLDHRGGPVGIHRDAYADQMIIDGVTDAVAGRTVRGDGDRDGSDVVTTVVDFDLYCLGDPALDVGNYVAHLTEAALRTTGNATALAAAETACVDAYLDLAGRAHAYAIGAYADLTLARHVALSTTVPGRSHLTDAVLSLCEARLA